MPPRPPAWFVITTFLGVLAFIAVVTTMVWDDLGNPIEVSRAEAVRNLALVAGGIVALIIAVWRSKAAQDQVNVSDLDRLDRLYLEGVSLLSDRSSVGRRAGIRMLGQLAKRNPSVFREEVVRVLCEFARGSTEVDESGGNVTVSLPRFAQRSGGAEGDRALRATSNDHRREEIEEAIRIISDCNAAAQSEHPSDQLRPNLTGLALNRAMLDGVNLSGAILANAELVDANLRGANLSGANLSLANLRAANLAEADLIDANLSVADLQHAQLTWSNLSHARLSGATLTDIRISHSNFSGAFIYPASVGLDDTDHVDAEEEIIVTGLTQSMADAMWAEKDNPPLVDGVADAETGKAIEWRGGTALPHQYTSWPRS